MKICRWFTTSFIALSLGSAAIGQTTQGCNDQIDRSTPTHRFALTAAGEAVEDLRTGRVWQRCPLGYNVDLGTTPEYLGDDRCLIDEAAVLSWQDALQTIEALNLDGGISGFTDWRLPTIHELISIAERRCHHPALNLSVFPATGDFALHEEYWSSTPWRTSTAYTIRFNTGELRSENIVPGGFLATPKRIRLVRQP